jgi:formimidoylglutamate deiminase
MSAHNILSSGDAMTQLWARHALLPTGWAQNVSVKIDAQGRIAQVQADTAPQGDTVAILLPAPVNVHSHAFQRAMAGLTERRGPDPSDSFWTWRQLMYRFLDRLTPDHVQAITAFAQMEMLQAGYATNAEFHYLHHQPGGRAYADVAEMSCRVAAAAADSGIGLCLLPVHYQFGGCDGRALGPGQIRFGCAREQFDRLHAGAVAALKDLPPDAGAGVAPHSLRAVGQDRLRSMGRDFPNGPIHMHLAEQRAEVAEVLAAWGARPVDWALGNLNMDARWCLIHCTQMRPAETQALAETGAVAGLCPITESSLGDGIFDGVRWLEHGGAIAIGSDSNIRIALAEELRTLDYSQRLRDGSRAALATSDKSTGRRMFDAIVAGGAQATQRATGQIAPGLWADLMTLDDQSVDLAGRSGDTLLDAWIFAGDDRMVRDVWSAGRHMVKSGEHRHKARITAAYARVLADLRDAL